MSSKTVFPCFTLSRELRDSIYDELLQDEVRLHAFLARTKTSSISRLNFLLVSKQFQAEFQERAQRAITFKLRYIPIEEPYDYATRGIPYLPKTLRSLPHLTLIVQLFCCDANNEGSRVNFVYHMKQTQYWIDAIVNQSDRTQQLALEWHLEPTMSRCRYEEMILGNQGFFTAYGRIVSCGVYLYDSSYVKNIWSDSSPRCKILQWSGERGLYRVNSDVSNS